MGMTWGNYTQVAARIQFWDGWFDWTGRRVLEIGCGEGRLTLRLASLGPAEIQALDPDSDSIKAARANLPRAEKGRIRYHVAQAENLNYPPGSFDIAVFSWVL